MKKIFLFLVLLVLIINGYNVNAKSSVVMDMDSGRILYKSKANDIKLIASITKIMTCIIVLEKSNLNDIVTVGEEVLPMYGTNIYIEVGEKLTVLDLLYGLMLRSGNDAAVVLAKYVSGSEEKFVKEMNLMAKKLGMNNTTFVNCHGLDDDTKNYSTAYDMALLSKYAFSNKKYREIISKKKYSCKSNLKSYIWYNRVSILNNYKYSLGGKNGYTPKAGKTLVSYAKKGDVTLGIVTIDDGDIYNNHVKLFNKYFDEYSMYKIVDKDNFYVDKTFFKDEVYLKESFSYLLNKNEVDNISTVINISNSTTNNIVGNIVIKLNDEKIGFLDIYSNKKKKQLSFLDKIKKIFYNFIY